MKDKEQIQAAPEGYFDHVKLKCNCNVCKQKPQTATLSDKREETKKNVEVLMNSGTVTKEQIIKAIFEDVEQQDREFIRKLKDVKVVFHKYPCDVNICMICNEDNNENSTDGGNIWFLYKGDYYHLKCLINKLAGEKLI